MKTTLQISHLTVTPGQSARVDIAVTNTADVIDGITALVDGINPDWVRLERPLVSVFPDASDSVELVFDIPRSCPAGDYLVVVNVVSTLDPERTSVQDFWLTVTEVIDLDLTLTPSIVTGGRHAEMSASVENTSNTPVDVTVNAWEPTRAIDCRVEPQTLVLPYGESAAVEVDLRGPRPWFGQPVAHSIIVSAQVGETVIEQPGTFNQKPRIPRGVITALILAAIILLWALIFLWVIGEVRSSEDPTKALATDFFGGTDDVPLAVVAGRADGRVTAATTGEGVERITVEANRITADGELQPVGSVATGEDGEYLLPALVPGTYKLRFSSDGFDDLWYPGAATAADATEIPIVPATVATDEELARSSGLDIEMSGAPGRLIGQVAFPGGSAPVPVTITATPVAEQTDENDPAAGGSRTAEVSAAGQPDGPAPADGIEPSGDAPSAENDGGSSGESGDAGDAGAGGADEDPSTTTSGADAGSTVTTNDAGLPVFEQQSPDGRIDLGPLPTPATYDVRISGEGFDTQTFEQRLGGGDATVLNTVRMSAASGSISGTVVNQSGSRLGEVTVTARAGDTTVTVTTPTTGNSGEFEFVGLETPQTYVLSFELEGFSSESLSLDLQPGEDRSGLQAILVGGNGVIDGVVTDVNGQPVGGAQVIIAGGDVEAETATLTAGSPGSFVVSDLPVPNRYTITVVADGFQTETVGAPVLAAGQTSVGSIALLPLTADIRGTINVGGQGAGDVLVTLDDGTIPRTTVSATNPAGAFVFADIAAGAYTLTFSRPDLDRRVVLVRVAAGVDVERSITLTTASVPT